MSVTTGIKTRMLTGPTSGRDVVVVISRDPNGAILLIVGDGDPNHQPLHMLRMTTAQAMAVESGLMMAIASGERS